MERINNVKNRQLETMLKSARERLKEYTPEDICERTGIVFYELDNKFGIESMGQEILIHYPDFIIDQQLGMWHHLTLLQYMHTADGISLSGKWIGLQQMPGGLSRGRGFDKDIQIMFSRYFSAVTKKDFLESCLRIGGHRIDGKADVSVIIPYAPRFPVMVNYWEADDEFPASGKVLVDAMAEHYLGIEAAGGACSAVIQVIRKQLEK